MIGAAQWLGRIRAVLPLKPVSQRVRNVRGGAAR
jgi:hypothetical protein